MADSVDIYTACGMHQAFSEMSGFGHRDDIAGAVFDAASAARDAALIIPANGLRDIHSKICLLINDSGCGFIEVEHLALIEKDISFLMGQVQ